jgi:hypothetical protein
MVVVFWMDMEWYTPWARTWRRFEVWQTYVYKKTCLNGRQTLAIPT